MIYVNIYDQITARNEQKLNNYIKIAPQMSKSK